MLRRRSPSFCKQFHPNRYLGGLASVTLAAAVLLLGTAADSRGEDVVVVPEPLIAAASPTPIADWLATEAPKLAAQQPDSRPVAIEYSEGHETRAKIHKYVSWATLPLIGTEFWLGQRLYDNAGEDDLRGVHGAVGAGLIGLFAVQSVTGVWNLLEEHGTPGHKKRLTHGLIMLAAEGGFIAAAAMAPGEREGRFGSVSADRSTHRTVALVSMGVGTAGYLWMLLTGGGR